MDESSPLDNPAAATMGGAMEYRPPFWVRFWKALGFGGNYNPDLLEFRYAELEGLADQGTMIGIVTNFPLLDRLRLLISGVIRIELVVRTDVVVRKSETMADVTVMAPRWKP